MTFLNPSYLYLLLLLPVLLLWHFLKQRYQYPAMTVAATSAFDEGKSTLRKRLIFLPFWLRLLTLGILIIALARPQTSFSFGTKEKKGIDIMMVMDISTSMLTPDLEPNRIEAAKKVAYEFINNRPNDNIGLTLFAGESFLQCPLTTDHKVLLKMFNNVTCDWQAQGIIAEGTAIGMGLSSAVAHLKDAKSKSKIIILLTDGENNTGDISPSMAAQLAKQLNIRVYTILLGSNKPTEQPVAVLPNGEVYKVKMENTTNPKALKEIAQATGGIYYQAGSKERLEEIYNDIDKLEKTKFKAIHYEQKYDAYPWFILAALMGFLLEIFLRITWLRRNP